QDEVRVLEKAAQKLLAAQQYSKAEPLLRLLIGGDGHAAAPRGVNVNEVLTELAQACAAQNKNRDAAGLYERLANRMTAVHRLPDSEKFLIKAGELREKDKNPDIPGV